MCTVSERKTGLYSLITVILLIKILCTKGTSGFGSRYWWGLLIARSELFAIFSVIRYDLTVCWLYCYTALDSNNLMTLLLPLFFTGLILFFFTIETASLWIVLKFPSAVTCYSWVCAGGKNSVLKHECWGKSTVWFTFFNRMCFPVLMLN